MYVFDLDGVLVDAADATRLAYESLGVVVPEGFYSNPGCDGWATEEQRSDKNDAMLSFAPFIKKLPLLSIAMDFNSIVLTSSSEESLLIKRRAVPELRRLQIKCNLRIEQKIHEMRSLGSVGIYFDDNAEFCDRAHSGLPGWQICHVRY